MKLKQTFEEPISGYFDHGPKKEFLWSIDGPEHVDSKGLFVKIGSWAANHWFHVALGKTEKLTLSYAKRRLGHAARFHGLKCSFEYIEDPERC